MHKPGSAPLRTGGAGFWALLLLVLSVDIVTKAWAVEALVPRHMPHQVIGDVVRFTLSYNPGAAFGMNIGEYSRWFFGVLSVVIVVFLLRTTRELVAESRLASIGVPIVIGGAVGNFLDRLRYADGVVDFIDIGMGNVRFWTFNVADMGVSIGAVCLVLSLWQIERARDATARVSK